MEPARRSLYRRIKTGFHWVMEEPSCPYRRFYHGSMMLLVVLSLAAMVLEVNNDNSINEATFFLDISNGLTVVFIVEYILRWWTSTNLVEDYQLAAHRYRRRVYKPNHTRLIYEGVAYALRHKFAWMVRPLSIIDLISCLPMLRVFRLLHVIWLLKFFRYSRRLAFFTGILEERRYEMVSLMYAGITIWGTVAIAFYLTEHGINEKVDSIWTSIYWAIITITTVGYGDIAPVTATGRIIASVGVLVGMSVTVLMTSIVVSVFTDRLFNLKEFHMERQIDRLRNHFIVCGLDALGTISCKSLQAEGKPFVAIDSDQQLVDKAIKEGWLAICGDVNEKETWNRAGLDRASCVIIAILNEMINVYTILMVRELHPKCFIVACGGTQNAESRLLRVGADRVVAPFQSAGQQMAQTALRPSALQFFRLALDQTHSALEMDEVSIVPGSILDGVTLQESDIRHSYDAIVVGVLAGGRTMKFNPQANYRLSSGDVVICLGHKDDLARLKRASKQISLDKRLVGLEIAEFWIPPDSPFDGATLQDSSIRERYNAMVVGVAAGGKDVQFNPAADRQLVSGDVIICLGYKEDLNILRDFMGEDALFAHQGNRANLELEHIRIPSGSPYHAIELRNSEIRKRFQCSVVGILHANEDVRFNPPPDYRIIEGDVLICLGQKENLAKMQEAVHA